MADSRTFLFSNNATAALAADITNVQTTITLAAGKGALFPSPGALQLAKITAQNLVTGAFEVMNCTSRSGDVLTVERGSESTTGQAFTASTAIVQLRITRETLEKLQESPAAGAINLDALTDVIITTPVTGHVLAYNGTNWVNQVPASGSPTDASYVVLGLHAGLSADRVLAVDAPITLTDGGANGNVTLGLAADGVTFAKMQNINTASFIGRITGGTGDPENLTGTQATTLIDLFTSSLKGLAPASGGGSTNFLRADGSWAVPSASASISAHKSANTSRSSTTTMTNDDHLVNLALDASSTYKVTMVLGFYAAAAPGSNGGIKIQLAYSGTLGSLGIKGYGTYYTAAVAPIAVNPFYDASAALFVGQITGTSSVPDGLLFVGYVHTSTSGSLSLQWAQNLSDADATTLIAGSFLEAVKIN